MNPILKKVTLASVRSTATTLILAHGVTTTLAVKMALRDRGYWARQADISQKLIRVALREGWSVNDNGTFRVYYFPTLPALVN